ncbi:hypothetical protein FA13DRAFT_1705206 [Coprinellus micaceus]|uniref:Uncharacterized protein n=1 Tax=Coprinellus micaceus TaxID=71717 RepID=A0A4Y7TWB5_COPMI|nr:hypothetical protein FA13DRAFT_1705206 [Coprinellus micaceus]
MEGGKRTTSVRMNDVREAPWLGELLTNRPTDGQFRVTAARGEVCQWSLGPYELQTAHRGSAVQLNPCQKALTVAKTDSSEQPLYKDRWYPGPYELYAARYALGKLLTEEQLLYGDRGAPVHVNCLLEDVCLEKLPTKNDRYIWSDARSNHVPQFM